MVRALKLAVSNSGLYKNLSQGIFVPSDNILPSSPTNCVSTNATNTSITMSWTSSTDNDKVDGFDVYSNGVFVGFTAINSFTISTHYPITIIAKDISGNKSVNSAPIVLNTTADVINHSAPTGLGQKATNGNSVSIYWKPSTDNIGVTSYEVYKEGEFLGSTYSVQAALSVDNAITVIAKDSAGNKSAVSATMHIVIGLYAYEGFIGSVNSGFVWGGNWSKTPAVNATRLTIEALNVAGGKLGTTAINMIRPLNLTIADGDSLCLSYLRSENASDLSFILTSVAGRIVLLNGRFQGDVVDAVQENSYGVANIGRTDGIFNTPVSVAGRTSFNLVTIKRTGLQFELKRWVYVANLPAKTPAIGDVNALTSGTYTSSALGYLDITGIKLICRNGTIPVYYDEIRMGHSFENVVPRVITAIAKSEIKIIPVFFQNGKLIADLSNVNGSSIVSVINANGARLKTIKSGGNEKLTISIPTNGIYLVTVQNNEKQFLQKIVFFGNNLAI